MRHLERAIVEAPRNRRAELARWATSDPAFQAMHATVCALVERLGMRSSPPAPASADDKPAGGAADFDPEIAHWELALSLRPQPRSRMKLAVAYARAGRFAPAIASLRRAIDELEPRSVDACVARVQLAALYEATDRTTEAVELEQDVVAVVSDALDGTTAAAVTVALESTRGLVGHADGAAALIARVLIDRERLLRAVFESAEPG